MISVVIPTRNNAATLPELLTGLVGAALDGLVKEVLLVDGGSTDATLAIADDAGAKILVEAGDPDARVAVGCQAARGDWLLLLGPIGRLSRGWEEAAVRHMADHARSPASFRLSHDPPSILRGLVANIGHPGPDSGLLVSRRLFDEAFGDTAVLRRRVRRLDARVILPA